MVNLTGHEAGNGGYTQGDTYRDAHTSPTRSSSIKPRILHSQLAKYQPLSPPIL
jgi:hypothetical protein